MKNFAFPSYRSLYLEVLQTGFDPAPATGFVVLSARGPLLITNRHVVSGADPFSGSVKRIPTALKIRHHRKGHFGEWVEKIETLVINNVDRWFEHPDLAETADFVALPLSELLDVELYPYDVCNPWYASDPADSNPKFLLGPTDPVSIIGFPFGKSSNGFPIWVTGFLASEPSENYLDRPIQLVDSRTRPGQSGSPVFAYRAGGMVATSVGTVTGFSGQVGKFIGVYSGRIDPNSDIGMIWKASSIQSFWKRCEERKATKFLPLAPEIRSSVFIRIPEDRFDELIQQSVKANRIHLGWD